MSKMATHHNAARHQQRQRLTHELIAWLRQESEQPGNELRRYFSERMALHVERTLTKCQSAREFTEEAEHLRRWAISVYALSNPPAEFARVYDECLKRLMAIHDWPKTAFHANDT